jgi:hypothetical protein
LSLSGPQSQRLLFSAAMQNVDNLYKLHSDTLRNTALYEASNYSAALSFADPLWLLYYRNEFEALLSQADNELLSGLKPAEAAYLISSGMLDWYKSETHALLERLELARETNQDRGSRILIYHNMLTEYKKLQALWETKKSRSKLFLSLKGAQQGIKSGGVSSSGAKTDIQIADDILKKSKL